MLIERDHRSGMVDAAIWKAKEIPREKALRYMGQKTVNRRPVFVVTYDPRLPSIHAITQKHWMSMVKMDPYMAEVFEDPPLVAYKRQKNIRDYTIRAKVPAPNFKEKRIIKGMKKCNKPCGACPYIKEGKTIKSNNFEWTIPQSVNCETYNVIYLIECDKNNCNEKYIGQTHRPLRMRLLEHRGYINSLFPTKATGIHFNNQVIEGLMLR